MFPGAQKLSLVDRIDGAPNYRGVSVEYIRKVVSRSHNKDMVVSPKIYGIGSINLIQACQPRKQS